MGWSVEIKDKVFVDGDEGTIYLPEEVYQYIDLHRFSIICVKHSKDKIESYDVRADKMNYHKTPIPAMKVIEARRSVSLVKR